MVAPRSAPHSSSAAITASAEALPAVRRVDLDAAEADPVVGVRRDAAGPLADPGRRRRSRSSSSSHAVAPVEDRRSARSARRAPGDPGDLEQRVRVVALGDPAVGAEQRRPRRSPGSTAAIGRPVRGGVERDDLRRSRRRPRTARWPAPSWPAGRSRWGSGAAIQSPSGSVSRSGHSASARRWASAGETRCRVGGRGGTGLPETMSAVAIATVVPSSRLDHAGAVGPRQADAEHVGERRTAARPGLAAQRPGAPRPAGPRRAGRARVGSHTWGSPTRTPPGY